MSQEPNLQLVDEAANINLNWYFDLYTKRTDQDSATNNNILNHKTKKLVLFVTASITVSHSAVSGLMAFNFILLVQ